MIESVSFEKTTFEKLPFKFEAGTPDYVATHGLAKAIDYVSALGMDNIAKHEQELTRYCMEQMKTIDGIRLFGEQEGKDAVVSFLVGDIHHMDMGTLLDRLGYWCPYWSSLCTASDGSLWYFRNRPCQLRFV